MFEAFEFGPLIFWTHLAFLLLAVWLAAEFFFRLALSANLPLQRFCDHAGMFVLSFLLGGRLVAILTEYRIYLRDPLRIIILWDGNFSFLGGAVGIACVLYFATMFHRSTFLQWLDVLLPATTFGLTFDWLGKFAAGQAYGKPTDGFFGVTYDALQVRYSVPVHPVQLYYAFFFFFLTFLLLIVRKYTKRAGAEMLVGTVLASLATFLFESFRGDFGIPVFATQLDFILLFGLFASLGALAALELRLSEKATMLYTGIILSFTVAYLIVRLWLPFSTFELRFSQLLSVLALLSAVVYVIIHRRRYPHL